MILRAPDPRQIMIAVESIPDANILTAKKSLRPDDLIVRIETNGKKAYPVSNIEDGVIWAVLARINEWIIQDEQLRTIKQSKVITVGLKYCSDFGYEILQDSKFCSTCGPKQELAA